MGGTKQDPGIVKYLVLQRKEKVEEVDKGTILGGKGDEEELKAAMQNIRESISTFHELKSSKLKPFMVSLNNDGENYSILTYSIPERVKDQNSKIIFMRQYTKGFKADEAGDFFYDLNKKISSFGINEVNWEEYKSLTHNVYFKGEKENIIFQISGHNYSSDEVKKFLRSLEPGIE